ncbi:MAG: diaminopimelate decarboxylase [Actinobacteria bacterium]|nr:diaminopimelate decarboxylase [Actinomycetota bacterium]
MAVHPTDAVHAAATPQRQAVFPRGARFDDGWLTALGGVAAADLAARFDTPLYVLDADELVGRIRAFRAAFDGWEVAYASKALCVTGVLQLAVAEGLSIDVASAGELATAQRAGVPAARLILHGNNKSMAELELAADVGVGRVVVDSIDELDRLTRIVERRGHVFDVLLRVTPGVDTSTHAFIRTGHDDSKFGFTLSTGQAADAVARAAAAHGVRLLGLHCHLGSQLLTSDVYVRAAGIMTAFLAELGDVHGVQLQELNLGGGFGITYTDETPAAVVDHAQALRVAVDAGCRRYGLPSLRVTVEPGRSIVGPAGVTLYEVGTVKALEGGRTYVSVDGGMSDNLRPALYGARHTFAPAGPPRAGPTQRVEVVGKHCESGDFLGRDVAVPDDLRAGDLLAVAATGAYTHAMSSNYNRLPRPAMVLVGDGRAQLLVRRETIDDVLARDQVVTPEPYTR